MVLMRPATTYEMRNPSRKHLWGEGFAIGLDQLTNFEFDSNYPYSGCRICGTIFQAEEDRNPGLFIPPYRSLDEVILYALHQRSEWSKSHAKQHSEREHLLLKLSGNWCTPEAAPRLAAFGIVPLSDIVFDEEVEDVLRKSSSTPQDDSEG